MQAQRKLLDAQRWHFQHGPIDLVIGADGDAAALASAHAAAWQRFEQVLPELVQELPQLRLAVSSSPADCPLQGPVARRMWHACRPYAMDFITPMAAVAGSVAQEIIACYQRPGIARAWVNNGGDIAMHLTHEHGALLQLKRQQLAVVENRFGVIADMVAQWARHPILPHPAGVRQGQRDAGGCHRRERATDRNTGRRI